MTLGDLEKRVADLERELSEMKKRLKPASDCLPWWMTGTGSFANDPGFEEIVRLGREYRESLRPDPKKKVRKRK